MSEGSLTVRSRDYLHRPISELIVPEAQVLVPAEAVREWLVDPAGLRAYTTWGLPTVGTGQLVPDPQPARHPGGHNGEDAYKLATEWAQPIGVLAGSGHLVRLDETHPLFVNSTLEAFVEAAWRYLWLIREEGGHADDENFELLDVFLDRMRQIDPEIGSDPDSSFWPSVVEHW